MRSFLDKIPSMTEIQYSNASEASELCKACGLCCTGHLFSWVRLKAAELTPSERLGLPVIRNDPRQRGFTQPCPMWNGICQIYSDPHYPRGCDSYKCKLLRELLDETVALTDAIAVVEKTKELIRAVEKHLPKSSHSSFRERFVAHVKATRKLSGQGRHAGDMQRAEQIRKLIENSFGVRDFFEKPTEETSAEM
jgi:hypothetical protein